MTLELTPKSRELLEELSTITDQSFSEVVRRALSIYGLIVQEDEKGSAVLIRDTDGTTTQIVLM